LRVDEVDRAEARVVVVVVDVDDVHAVALEEVDRHPVDIPAVQEHHGALAQIGRWFVLHLVERHLAVLPWQRELVRSEEHHRVLSELLEHLVHAEQGAERVAVGVLVRRQEELLRRAQLLENGVYLDRHAHLLSSSSKPLIRMPVSIESS
jgi:hypothetical protein